MNLPSRGCRKALRWLLPRAWPGAAVTCTAVGLVCASQSQAIPPPPPPEQAVAILARGIIWFDAGSVLRKGFDSGYTRLRAPTVNVQANRGLVASSATAVAALLQGEEGQFVGGLPPGPLKAVSDPPLLRGAGCRGWKPGTDLANFVVADDDLVTAAECHWEDHYVRQPLFVKSLRGGPWRVLRWLPGDWEPVLAAEGNLVAVGIHRAAATMRVSVLDVAAGRTVSEFDAPEGYIGFASRDRLLLSIPQVLSSPEVHGVRMRWEGPYQLATYSLRGKRIANLGTEREVPLVSGRHLVKLAQGTISVRDLAGRGARPVISFNEARELDAFAFQWPMLAVVEATRVPREPSEIGCWMGDYRPPGKPFLQIIDLARSEPLQAPPPLVHVQPSSPLENCGPAPP